MYKCLAHTFLYSNLCKLVSFTLFTLDKVCIFSQGAARRLTTQRKNVEIESVGAVKSDNNKVKKFFRMEVGKIPTKKSRGSELP